MAADGWCGYSLLFFCFYSIGLKLTACSWFCVVNMNSILAAYLWFSVIYLVEGRQGLYTVILLLVSGRVTFVHKSICIIKPSRLSYHMRTCMFQMDLFLGLSENCGSIRPKEEQVLAHTGSDLWCTE